MAKVVKEWPGRIGRSGFEINPKYFNGKIWSITTKDIPSKSLKSLAAKFYLKAKILKVKVRIVIHNKSVFIQKVRDNK